MKGIAFKYKSYYVNFDTVMTQVRDTGQLLHNRSETINISSVLTCRVVEFQLVMWVQLTCLKQR